MKTKHKLLLEEAIEKWFNEIDRIDEDSRDFFIPDGMLEKMVEAAAIVYDMSEESARFTQDNQ